MVNRGNVRGDSRAAGHPHHWLDAVGRSGVAMGMNSHAPTFIHFDESKQTVHTLQFVSPPFRQRIECRPGHVEGSLPFLIREVPLENPTLQRSKAAIPKGCFCNSESVAADLRASCEAASGP